MSIVSLNNISPSRKRSSVIAVAIGTSNCPNTRNDI
jgi:hypothetical protein